MKYSLAVKIWQLFIILLAAGLLAYRLQSGETLVAALICALTVLLAGLPLPLFCTSPLVLHRVGRRAEELGVTVRKASKSLALLAEAPKLVICSGTMLTKGEPFIEQLIPEGISQNSLLALAASVANGSSRPLPRLIYDTASDRHLRLQPAIGFNEVPGQGIEAVISRAPVRIGTAAWLKNQDVEISAELLTRADQLALRGKLPYFVSSGKYTRGLIVIEDEITIDTISSLHRLQRLGLSLLLLSDANKRTVTAMRKQTGIDEARAELTQGEKAREVQLLRTRHAAIAILGDPEQDAEPFAAADLRLAWLPPPAPAQETEADARKIETAADENLAKELSEMPPAENAPAPAAKPKVPADILLPKGDLLALARLRHRAEKAMEIVRQHRLIAAAAYAVLVPLATGLLIPFGLPALSPFLAFCGNVGIAILILLLSLRA